MVLDKKAPYNKHWDLQVHLSYICAIKYDYLIKTETMNDDSEPILHLLSMGLHEDAQLVMRRGNTKRGINQVDLDFNRPLPQMDTLLTTELAAITGHLAPDMRAFGYAWKKNQNGSIIATCGYHDNLNCC